MKTYDIPQRWQVLKLRQILCPFSEKNHPELQLLSVVREKGVIIRNTACKEENHNYIPDDLSSYKRVKVGQFAMNKMKAWQGSYGVSKYEGIVSPAYFVFDIIPGMNLDFFNFAIRSKVYVSYFGRASDGIRVGQWDLSIDRMKEIPFFVPPREEQDQIVRFLDWKVSEINRLINIKRKEISELETLKIRTITEATVKGLDAKSPLKNSSSAWIGNIPEHWDVLPIRRNYAVILGKMLSPTPSSESDTLEEYVCAKDVHFDGVTLSELKKMWFSPNEKKQYRIVSGDLLVVEGGAGAGNAAILEKTGGKDIYVQNSIHIIRSKHTNVINEYLRFWLLSLVKRGYMKSVCSVATIPHYTKDKVMATLMPLPPLNEQIAIVNYLNEQCNKIDTAIWNIKEIIVKLSECKARLIADTVTGKIDVRGIEIPEYEFMDEDAESENDAEDFEESEEE